MRLPFALTERFRQLTQAGSEWTGGRGCAEPSLALSCDPRTAVGVPALDISYVSSMSFFMIASSAWDWGAPCSSPHPHPHPLWRVAAVGVPRLLALFQAGGVWRRAKREWAGRCIRSVAASRSFFPLQVTPRSTRAA